MLGGRADEHPARWDEDDGESTLRQQTGQGFPDLQCLVSVAVAVARTVFRCVAMLTCRVRDDAVHWICHGDDRHSPTLRF